MKHSILYLRDSGHIVQTLSVTDTPTLSLYETPTVTGIVVETEGDIIDMTAFYVADGVVQPREILSPKVSALVVAPGTEVVLSGLPAKGCWLSCNLNGSLEFVKKTFKFTPFQVGTISVEFLGQYVGLIEITVVALEEAKTAAKATVDAEAEAARALLTTQGTNQAVTYMRKAEAARLFLAGATLTDAQRARLQTEADATGVSVEDMAKTIVEAADRWEAADAEIDTKRLKAKATIDGAKTSEEINTIITALVW